MLSIFLCAQKSILNLINALPSLENMKLIQNLNLIIFQNVN